jgi:hypothetical protein
VRRHKQARAGATTLVPQTQAGEPAELFKTVNDDERPITLHSLCIKCQPADWLV